MSASLTTTNYKLPLYADEDIVEPLTDFNGAMNKLDGLLKSINDNLTEVNNIMLKVGDTLQIKADNTVAKIGE